MSHVLLLSCQPSAFSYQPRGARLGPLPLRRSFCSASRVAACALSATLVLLATASGVPAQDLVLYVHNPNATPVNGVIPDGVVFPGPNPCGDNCYPFSATSVGDSSSVTLRLRNTSDTNTYWILAIDFPPGSAFVTQTPPAGPAPFPRRASGPALTKTSRPCSLPLPFLRPAPLIRTTSR